MKTIKGSWESFKKINQLIYNFRFFLQRNVKKFFFILGISLIILVYSIYRNFYMKFRQEKALNYLFYARKYFVHNEIKKALGGSPSLTKGGYMGFYDIINKFSSTPAANIACFYAGLSNYKLRNYEKALELWKNFSAKDEFLFPMKYGIIADTYDHLNKDDLALMYYIKAAEAKNNEFTTPLYLYKAAIKSFNIKKYHQAKKYFTSINNRYPKNSFSEEIDKYLCLIDAKL